MEPVISKHIESDPNRCGGKPCIVGTRIRVWDIYVAHELHGKTPDEITAEYAPITLADVHAALAYYFDHKAAIDAEMREADRWVDEFKRKMGSGPLAKKLASTDSTSDTVST